MLTLDCATSQIEELDCAVAAYEAAITIATPKLVARLRKFIVGKSKCMATMKALAFSFALDSLPFQLCFEFPCGYPGDAACVCRVAAVSSGGGGDGGASDGDGAVASAIDAGLAAYLAPFGNAGGAVFRAAGWIEEPHVQSSVDDSSYDSATVNVSITIGSTNYQTRPWPIMPHHVHQALFRPEDSGAPAAPGPKTCDT